MTTQVTTIGTVGTMGAARRPSLEELVDRLIAAMFPQEEETTQTVARSAHDARRLRQTGDLDGALAVFAGVNTANTETSEARWAYAEWLDLVKRRFGDKGMVLYSQGKGRGCGPVPQGRRDPGGHGCAGDALAAGQASVQAQPAGPQNHRR